MNVQDVIAYGETINIPNEYFHMPLVPVAGVLFMWCIILIITVNLSGAIDGNREKSILGKSVRVLGIIAGCVSTTLIISWYNDIGNTYAAETAKWKAEMAYPYIKSQDYIDLELTSIEKDPYAGENQPDEIIKYRNAEQIIEQLDSPEETRYDDTRGKKSYQLIYDVPAGEKPFVRFYMLGEDLGHGVKIGAYGLDVHLNEK